MKTKSERDYIFWQLLMTSVMANPIKRRGRPSMVPHRSYVLPDENLKHQR